MRVFRAILVAAMILGPLSATAETLTILHTNDVHSRIEPINKYGSTCSAEDLAADKCLGGSARLATAIAEARAASDNTILLDGGDQFQGSLFFTHYKGQAAAELMNAMGYEAMVIGNHEFDDGTETLRRFIDAVDFPVLLANADVSQDPHLADVVAGTAVIEKGGHKIGIIGVAPVDTLEVSKAGQDVVFFDPVPAVQEAVEKLQVQGIDRIILLSHSGLSEELRIAENVEGLDVIVGGHSHSLLSNSDKRASGPYPIWVDSPNGGRTAVVQAGSNGTHLGRLEVTFDDNGNVVEAVGDPIPIAAAVAEDPTIKARVAELSQPLDDLRRQVVAQTTDRIDGQRQTCRTVECQMGNLVTDAMLDRVRDQGITIAITNSGGLRASIDPGEITMGEILTVLPFQNTLSTFQLSGADIITSLESGVSQIEHGRGRFPQVAGLRFTVDTQKEPNQGRVSDVRVQKDGAWVPIDPAAIYGVVSNNFLRGGGDGYVIFDENAINPYDHGPNLEQVVVDYLRNLDQPYEPFIEGRIQVR